MQVILNVSLWSFFAMQWESENTTLRAISIILAMYIAMQWESENIPLRAISIILAMDIATQWKSENIPLKNMTPSNSTITGHILSCRSVDIGKPYTEATVRTDDCKTMIFHCYEDQSIQISACEIDDRVEIEFYSSTYTSMYNKKTLEHIAESITLKS
jgi:hypothetical protein